MRGVCVVQIALLDKRDALMVRHGGGEDTVGVHHSRSYEEILIDRRVVRQSGPARAPRISVVVQQLTAA